jgi:hypothetical protein
MFRLLVGPLKFALSAVACVVVSAVPTISEAPEASGHKIGATIEVEWRQSVVTVFAPDLMVLVRSRSEKKLVVALEWQPRDCHGRAVELSHRSTIFLAQLFRGRSVYRSALEPGEWISLILPVGLTISGEEPHGDLEHCESTVVVRAGVGEKAELLSFSVPLEAPSTEQDLPRHP